MLQFLNVRFEKSLLQTITEKSEINTLFLGFFHPYGEISNIVYVPAGKSFPIDITRRNLFNQADFASNHCAVIEFLTARVAKFVVGVLRKRIEGLNFRIGLLKPGLSEEMKIQSRRLEESIHIPTFSTKTQDQFLQERESGIQYSSEELSENETITKVNYFI